MEYKFTSSAGTYYPLGRSVPIKEIMDKFKVEDKFDLRYFLHNIWDMHIRFNFKVLWNTLFKK